MKAINPELWMNSNYTDVAVAQQKPDRMRFGDPDMFLKLMCTELKHQDPTNPADAKEMQSALASFATVEQLSKIGGNIEKMMGNMQMMQFNSMNGLVGKEVLIDNSSHALGADGSISFDYMLPDEAENVRLLIVDKNGLPVKEFLLGQQAQGKQSLLWNGLGIDGKRVPADVYKLQVEAWDKKSHRMAIDQVLRVRIDEVRPAPNGGEVTLISNSKEGPRMYKMGQLRGFVGTPEQPASAQALPPPMAAPSATKPEKAAEDVNENQQPQYTGIPIEDPLGQNMFEQSN
jgi:flagellar basal-body rod modification protein FlgD